MIKFGTDGWRAIIGEDFNERNVELVTLAIGKYVADNFGLDKQIILGYDPRNMANVYAKQCADILSEKGFIVTLSSKVVPTPVLAYNALFRNACAIMFTASHNPPEYLGMKFIPDYAGPATSEITDEIVANIGKEFVGGVKKMKTNTADFSSAYFEHIKTIIDFKKIKDLKSSIIFDGLYSASIGYLDKILKNNGIKFDSIHMQHDSNFGGLMPDPKPKYLASLIDAVNEKGDSIGISTDGDADRFGVIDESGFYVSPDVIIAILLKYLIKKGYKGKVVKTVGSSILIDEFAKKLGIEVIETAVGFKHIGNAMRNNRVIIGGEESGGLSIYGHIPEKDGLLANLLLLEAIADSGETLETLHQQIYEFIGCKFYTNRHDFKKTDSEEINKLINLFKGVKQIGEYEVTDVNLTDGVKLMLGDKAKVLVRPSGTEPLLRVYFEADNRNKLKQIEDAIDDLIEKNS